MEVVLKYLSASCDRDYGSTSGNHLLILGVLNSKASSMSTRQGQTIRIT